MYNHMLKQTIEISTEGTADEYNDTTFASVLEHKARVELVNKAKVTATGEMIPISARVWVKPDVAGTAGDGLRYGDTRYKIISRKEVPDGTGKIRLVELECTEWR